jgi:DNA-binding response OmpR family regulator
METPNTDSRSGQRAAVVAEDENEVRFYLVMMLEGEGLKVHEAADGATALVLLKEHCETVDILVTDLGLPKLEGIELIREAKKVNPALKVIAASGFAHYSVQKEVIAAGADLVFQKPFSPSEILSGIRELLGSN